MSHDPVGGTRFTGAECVGASDWFERARSLKEDGWALSDLAGLDTTGLGGDGDRFEVVIQLTHFGRRRSSTVHVFAQGEPPAVPSVVDVWPAADFLEREAFDMFGIRFDGHPNLVRILMPDEWIGHPLRKDYGVGKAPVEFIEQALIEPAAQGETSTDGAPDVKVDRLGQAIGGNELEEDGASASYARAVPEDGDKGINL